MMIDAAVSEVGRRLGLPTHSYLALSDSKTLDYQAGLETGIGALVAAVVGINVVSGPGILEFVSCQSAEKLVLDHEACAMALRALRGLGRREEAMAVDVIQECVQGGGEFLKAAHTRRWFRKELHFPGPVIDRQVGDAWVAAGARTAAERAHEETGRLLAREGASPLEDAAAREIHALMAH